MIESNEPNSNANEFCSEWDATVASNFEDIQNKDMLFENDLLDPCNYFKALLDSDLNLTPYLNTCTQDNSGGPSYINKEMDTNLLPATNTWEGKYKFSVHFDETKNKSTSSWTYSEIKKKLFVNMDKSCPISFGVASPPPEGSFIRAMAVFSKPEHQTDIVKRCLNHSSLDDSSNTGAPAPPNHLIRCNNVNAQYFSEPRHSVLIPYENPHPGANYTTYIYKFMCLGTCVGGINRRPLKVIFTLEKNGIVLGRQVLEVKVCASPFRDKNSEEKSGKRLKRIKCESTEDLSDMCHSNKQNKKRKNSEDVYLLKIHGFENYRMLKKIRDSLEISQSLSPEQIATLKNESSDGE